MSEENDSVNNSSRLTFLAVVTLPLIFASTIGNSLSFLLLNRLSQSATSRSSAYYLKFLAITDTLTVHTLCWRYFLIGIQATDIFTVSDGACKAQMFVNYCLADVSVWLVPCISTDRALALYRPVAYRVCCTRKFAFLLFLGLIVLTVCKNIILLVGLQVDSNTPANLGSNQSIIGNISSLAGLLKQCRPSSAYQQAWQVRNAFAMVMLAIIPVAVTMATNAALLAGVRRRIRPMPIVAAEITVNGSSMNSEPQNQQRRGGSSGSSWHSLLNSIRITMSISLAYILLMAPFFIFLNVIPHLPPSAANDFVLVGLEMMFYLNSAINFIMYVIASPLHRRHLADILRCRRKSSR